MDNNKIGKLIADLRRKQGLTQEQLGEKVGVGFRAVSKWECGKTLPDIGIINELSKILGISSDELLSGELKSKDNTNSKKKISLKIIITISILTVMLIFISTIYMYQSNKVYTYKIFSEEENEYYVDGIANYKNGNISVVINKIKFKEKEFNNTIIENYEYKVSVKENIIFSFGFIDGIEQFDSAKSIKEFTEKLSINFNAETKMPKDEFIKNNMMFKFNFLNEDKQIITKEIKITFSSTDKK